MKEKNKLGAYAPDNDSCDQNNLVCCAAISEQARNLPGFIEAQKGVTQ